MGKKSICPHRKSRQGTHTAKVTQGQLQLCDRWTRTRLPNTHVKRPPPQASKQTKSKILRVLHRDLISLYYQVKSGFSGQLESTESKLLAYLSLFNKFWHRGKTQAYLSTFLTQSAHSHEQRNVFGMLSIG